MNRTLERLLEPLLLLTAGSQMVPLGDNSQLLHCLAVRLDPQRTPCAAGALGREHRGAAAQAACPGAKGQ